MTYDPRDLAAALADELEGITLDLRAPQRRYYVETAIAQDDTVVLHFDNGATARLIIDRD